MLHRALLVGACAVLAMSMVVGCGGPPTVKTAAVSGELKIGGKPAEGVTVMFSHPTQLGSAVTDAQGKFTVQAVPGQNKVFFSKIEGAGSTESGMDAGMMMAEAGAGTGAAVLKGQVIPEKYSRLETTDKTFTVPETGAANANFDL